MEYLPILVVISLVLSLNVQEILTEGLSWSEANQHCDENGLEYDVGALKNSTIPNGKKFWFGMAFYLVRTPWLELLGCYNVSDSLNATISLSIVTCQQKCNSSRFFGYKNNAACVCLDELNPRVNPQTCKNDNYSSYYFVFGEFNSSNLPYDGNHNCTTIKCLDGNNNIKAADCGGTDQGGICENNNKTDEKWDKSFLESLEHCMEKGQLLLPPTICNKYPDMGQLAWTNVFFEVLKAKLRNYEAGDKSPIKCISAELTEKTPDRERKLIMTEKNCKSKLQWYICKNSNSGIMVTEDYLPTTQSDYDETVESTYTGAGNVATGDYLPTNQSDDDSAIGPIVGGICGAVVLLMASVVLVVCWKRKVGLFKKEKKVNHKTEFSNVTYDSSTVFTETNGNVKPTIKPSFEVATNNIKAEYAQVNKKSNMNPISHQANDTYAESSNGEYDRLNNFKNRKIQQNENTYDSNKGFRDQNDPTYDISTSGIRSDKDYDVYDHSFQTESSNSDYGYSTSGMAYCTDKRDVYDRTF